MDRSVIILIIQLVIVVGSFFIGKYLLPFIGNNKETIETVLNQVTLISTYADSFVAYAKQFMKKSNGAEKMEEVVSQLNKIADRHGFSMTEEEIKAIAQKAYDNLKAGEEAAELEKKKAEAAVQNQTIVIPPYTGELVEPGEGVSAIPLVLHEGADVGMDGSDNILLSEETIPIDQMEDLD